MKTFPHVSWSFRTLVMGSLSLAASAQSLPDQESSSIRATQAEPECEIGNPEQREVEQANSYHVSLANGEQVFAQVDLAIRGRGIDFVWKRTYRSRHDKDGALGHNWTHSYDIRVQTSGADLLLEDGTGRVDRYFPNGTNAWSAPDQTRTITFEPSSGRYIVLHRHGARWLLAPLGFPWAGRIEAIEDKNLNRIEFQYDSAGRLQLVTDTLGRVIDVIYGSNGRIAELEDFATEYGLGGRGRVVEYGYFVDADVGGSDGDLASVTSPAVVGTSTGNDFPSGKTWTYFYDESSVVGLRHNLIAVFDPEGLGLFRNFYGTVPASLAFDAVRRQDLPSGPTGVSSYHYVYVTQVPSGSNNGATSKTIVNDRMGNVRELSYDGAHLCQYRMFTGRANPALPTTETTNRPVGPLHPSDPPFFQTRYAVNSGGLVTSIDHPNGAWTEWLYDSTALDPRGRANLLRQKRFPGSLGADQDELCELWSYNSYYHYVGKYRDAKGYQSETLYDGVGFNDSLGSCDFPLTSARTRGATTALLTSGGGNAVEGDCPGGEVLAARLMGGCCTSSSYNAHGQPLQLYASNGALYTFTYYPSGPMAGYLESLTLDDGGASLRFEYEYDSVGNTTVIRDPSDNEVTYEVNALSQVVQVTYQAPLSYQRRYHYDGSNHLVQIDVANVDLAGAPDPSNPWLTSEYDFDVLGNLTRVEQEASASETVIAELAYDANENRRLLRRGEAVNGNQVGNVVEWAWDERDLLFTETRGPGASQSTTQLDYDWSGNLWRVASGLEDTTPREWFLEYDGFDRLRLIVDPMGNEVQYAYDPNGNRVTESVHGEVLDVPGSAGNVLLRRTVQDHDERDRWKRSEADLFKVDASGVTTYLPGSPAVWELEYSGDDALSAVVDPNGGRVEYRRDALDRLTEIEDQGANLWTIDAFDGISNPQTTSNVDRSTLGSAFDELFVQQWDHDALGRLEEQVDSALNTHAYLYDARDNLRLFTGPDGEETLHVYDGLDRPIMVVTDMDGDGPDAADGVDVVIQQVWDDSSRLIASIDDKGRATRYAWDELDRVIGLRMADGTLWQVGTGMTWASGTDHPDLSAFVTGYDVHGNPLLLRDPNGTVIHSTFDVNDRVVGKTIDRAAVASGDPTDVLGSTTESFQYDGLDRVVLAVNNETQVKRQYDSNDNVIQESLKILTLPWRTTNFEHDAKGNIVKMIYPSAATVEFTHDALDRRRTVTKDGLPWAAYDFVGASRVARRDLRNGIRTTFDYDGDRRPEDIVSTKNFGAGPILAHHAASWTTTDAVATKTDVLRDREDRATYDALDRIKQRTLHENGTLTNLWTYRYDGVQNRTRTTQGTTHVQQLQYYTMDAGAPFFDAEVNQYTSTPSHQLRWDENGNLFQELSGSVLRRTFSYDYRNLLVKLVDTVTGKTHLCGYDALGRRAYKVADYGGAGQDVRMYSYGGEQLDQVIEEHNIASALLVSYVHGNYVDEVVSMTRTAAAGSPGDYYFIQDHHYSTVALTNSVGGLVETYEYADFGGVTYRDALGAPITASLVGNAYLFTGREWDSELRLYHYRTRYLDPIVGHFTTRDSLGVWGDRGNLGNGRAYVGNNPWTLVDPSGQFLDTLWDIANVAYDAGRAIKNVAEAGYEGARYGVNKLTGDEEGAQDALDGLKEDLGELGEAAVDIAADGLATAIPGVPAGSTKVLRGTAKAARAKNLAKGLPEACLGPSGKPKRHFPKHPNRKSAKDAAKDESKGGSQPVDHSNPANGDPHFHPADADGEKIPNGVHHTYPK